jgi:hypothetical protein
MTEWLVNGRCISIGPLTLPRRSKSGRAIRLTAKISLAHILKMADQSLLFKDANLGGEVTVNATVHLQYSDDGEPTWPEPVSRVAI